MLLSVSANLRIGAMFLICIFAVASISPLNVALPVNVEIPVTSKLPFNEVSPRTSNSCVGEVLLIPTLSVPSPSWIVFPNIFNIPVLFSM